MHSKFQTFLKYFKYEAKSLSRSSKLNFNKSFDRIFLYFITLFPASNKEPNSLSKVADVFCRSSVLVETPVKSSVNDFFTGQCKTQTADCRLQTADRG